jgi:hypothetical protein
MADDSINIMKHKRRRTMVGADSSGGSPTLFVPTKQTRRRTVFTREEMKKKEKLLKRQRKKDKQLRIKLKKVNAAKKKAENIARREAKAATKRKDAGAPSVHSDNMLAEVQSRHGMSLRSSKRKAATHE